MWIQTTEGTFAVARYPEDLETGMLRLQSNNFEDLEKLIRRYSIEFNPEICKGGAFKYFVLARESEVSLLVAKLVSDVWYQELPAAIENLNGIASASNYYDVYKHLYGLRTSRNTENQSDKAKSQTILLVGCEGGSLSVGLVENDGVQLFVVKASDSFAGFQNGEDFHENVSPQNQINEFPELSEAIASLSRFKWWKLFPLEVDPRFSELFQLELLKRGIKPSIGEWGRFFNQK